MHRHRRRARAARSPTRSAARPSPSNAERRAARRPRRPLPQARPARVGRARGRAAREGRRLDPRRDAARATSRPPTRTAPCTASCPSTPVEVRQGAVILAADDHVGPADPRRAGPRAVRRARHGSSSSTTRLIDVAMGLMSNAPAYYALVAEAQVDAGVRQGIPPRQAAELVVADDGRHRRAAAPPRVRHARRAPRRSPRPAARPRAASTRSSAAACGRRSPTRWTRS